MWITDENEAAQVDLAASHGVSVINMSYGAYDDWGYALLIRCNAPVVEKTWQYYICQCIR